MKYRFIKETFFDRVRFSTERKNESGGWEYVSGSVSNDEQEGRELFQKIVCNGSVPSLEILEETK